MNWMKVKIILIILFLIINLTLIGVLISQNYESSPDSEKMAEDVHKILISKGISIEKDLVTANTGSFETADAYPISSEASGFLGNLITNGELSGSNTYRYGGSEITVYDNLVHFESLDLAYSDTEDYFSSVGLDFSNAELISEENTEGGFIYRYTEKYDGLDIFGSVAEIRIQNETVASADVVWYEISEKYSQKTKTISIAEALLDFAADKGRGNKPCTVLDIAHGFSVDAGTENASVSQMIPCIRITTDIGSSFYYDARSPEQ